MRSISQPEQGMAHVSKKMNNVKPHCTSLNFQCVAARIGSTNNVQAYCKFAIIIIAITAAPSLTQRFNLVGLLSRFDPKVASKRTRFG